MINEDKWESSTNQKMRKTNFDEWSKYFFWLDPSYEKEQKLKNVKQSILIHVQFFFGEHLFT